MAYLPSIVFAFIPAVVVLSVVIFAVIMFVRLVRAVEKIARSLEKSTPAERN